VGDIKQKLEDAVQLHFVDPLFVMDEFTGSFEWLGYRLVD
jgi:hypothetical protein